MTDQEIPRKFEGADGDDEELNELVDKRLKSWRALREQDGTHEGTVRTIAQSYEMMKRNYEIQRAVVGQLVSRIEKTGKELAVLRKKND
jgi:hypothetical protein